MCSYNCDQNHKELIIYGDIFAFHKYYITLKPVCGDVLI